jgi:RNA-directed DNA polymerase
MTPSSPIKGFFDNVDHDILLDILRRDIHDRRLLKVIGSMLKAGMVYEGVFEETESGTPQGGIASPILGNIYLNELDIFIASKYEHLSPYERRKATVPCFIVRYADDAVILCRTKEHAEALKTEVAEFLREHLHLQLSEEKTLVTHVDDGFDFLGFNIRRWKRQGRWNVLVRPSRKAIQKFKENMARDSRALQTTSGVSAIGILNGKIRGFAEYFRRGNSKDTFLELDYYLWWLVYRRIQQRTREPPTVVIRKYLHRYNEAANFPQYRKYTARNFGFKDDDKNVHMLDQLSYYKVEYPDKCSQRNPYVPEEREWLDANRKLRGLMKAQQVRYLQRLYGTKQNWAFYRTYIVRRQNGRCANCDRRLTQGYTHVHDWRSTIASHELKEQLEPDHFLALCIPCYRKTRQLSRTRAL